MVMLGSLRLSHCFVTVFRVCTEIDVCEHNDCKRKFVLAYKIKYYINTNGLHLAADWLIRLQGGQTP